MSRFLIILGLIAGGWLGWIIGEGGGMMVAFIVSTVGSIGGVVLGWWVTKKFYS